MAPTFVPALSLRAPSPASAVHRCSHRSTPLHSFSRHTALPHRRVPLTSPCMHAAPSTDSEDGETTIPLVNPPAADAVAAEDAVAVEDEEADDRTELQKENDRLRAAEKFIVVNEGKFECPGCDYMYEPTKGDFLNGIKKGTLYEDLPVDFRCPVCRTPKTVFVPVKTTIAGFADNQGYGFGTNSLTAGQKNGLIFGSLAFLFCLLLSGYALN